MWRKTLLLYGFVIPVLISLFLPLLFGTLSAEGKEDTLPVDGPFPDALREPDITIEMPAAAEVVVEPGNSGVITLQGTVYCEMPQGTPPGQYCVVTINADAGGWPVSIPSSLYFDYLTEMQKISLSVTVPIESSAGRDYWLSTSAKWHYSPGTQGGATGATLTQIMVDPYSKLWLSAMDTDNMVQSGVGKWGDLTLKLMNEGNAQDNVTFSVSCPSNVEIMIGNGPVASLDEKSFMEVNVRTRQKTGSPRTNPIEIVAKGSYPGANSTVSCKFYLKTSVSPTAMVTSPVFLISGALVIVGIVLAVLIILKVRKKRSKGPHLDI